MQQYRYKHGNMYWYKNAIIYSLDVRTFKDSNGDGTGDLTGLMQCLDYLAGLGINCLWILPFYPSPGKDGGYDITDHYDVDEKLGTLQEFILLVDKAKELGIRILVDLVVNHTSDQHPWFREARRDPNSKYRKYYIWAREKPENDSPDPIFKGVQDSNWAYDETAGEWYYHTFYDFQPDLNVSNPAVQEEIRNVVRFWLELGVHGFRIDAVPHMLRQKGTEQFDGDPHDFLRELRKFAVTRDPDVVLMGEADTKPYNYKDFFGNGDQLHMLLNFYLNNYLFLALARQSAEPLTHSLKILPHVNTVEQFANFIRNHDELDLERLTAEERELVMKQFAPEDDMRIYGRGIRRRLPPMLHNDSRRIKLAYSLLFSLPGTPVLRYGEEIGMGDLLSQKERYSVRTVMQWAHTANGGFSSAPADQLVQPAISSGEYSFEKVNVYEQAHQPASLLNTISIMINTRKAYPAFGWGWYDIVETDHPGVLAHISRQGTSIAITLHNFTEQECSVTLDLPEGDGRCITEILSDHPYETFDGQWDHIRIGPYGYRWLYRWPLPPVEGVAH
ncbi:alpha-amylase family protein [Chitinophaga japonensis]